MGRQLSWFVCFLLIFISIGMYLLESIVWYNILVIGVWFLFDNLAKGQKRRTTIDLIIKRKYKKFTILFFSLLLLGVLIEVVGSLLLGLWTYPKLWSITPFGLMVVINIWGYLSYPFILMSFREMYNYYNAIIKSNIFDVVLFIITGVLIWEVPNIFSRDWVYFIPTVSTHLFGINIIVIFGWVLLIIFPLWVYKIVDMHVK